HGRGNLALLEYLVLEKVAAVLAKLRMERQAKQPVRSALIEKVFRDVTEQRLHVIRCAFFKQPNLAGLMHDEERVADSRELAEPNQSRTHVPRLVDERVREPQVFCEERTHRDR